MKKLLLFISLLLFAVGLNAQYDVTKASGTETSIPTNQSFIRIATTAADTVGGTAVKYWILALNKSDLQLYTWLIKLDTIKTHTRGAGNRVKVQFYGSMDKSTWVQVGSNIFYNVNAGTNADSTFAVSDVSTGILWPYMKVQFTGVTANKCSKPVAIQIRRVSKKP